MQMKGRNAQQQRIELCYLAHDARRITHLTTIIHSFGIR